MFKLTEKEIERLDQKGLQEVINWLKRDIERNIDLNIEDKKRELEYLKQFVK